MERIMINVLEHHINKEICIKGWVHRIRKLSKIVFIQLRDGSGLVQCVLQPAAFEKIKSLKLESIIEVHGTVCPNANSTGNIEVQAEYVNVICHAYEDIPITINTDNLDINIDTELNHRVLSLRSLKNNAVFKAI